MFLQAFDGSRDGAEVRGDGYHSRLYRWIFEETLGKRDCGRIFGIKLIADELFQNVEIGSIVVVPPTRYPTA